MVSDWNGWCVDEKAVQIQAFPKIKHDACENLMDDFLQEVADVEMRRHITVAYLSGVDQAVSLTTEYETLTQINKGSTDTQTKTGRCSTRS